MNKSLPLSDLQLGAKLVRDYLNKKPSTAPFYSRSPSLCNLQKQATDKLPSYKHRTLLCSVLEEQHAGLSLSQKQKENLRLLARPNTGTITTGHQLNIFTGPLYSIIKILEVVKASNENNLKDLEYKTVPIFWMASEDHDFDEINHFWKDQYKFEWEAVKGDAVGRIPTNDLADKGMTFWDELPLAPYKKELKNLFREAYNKENLAEASRCLIHTILGKYGILILDGDDPRLKNVMLPYWRAECREKLTFKAVTETNLELTDAAYATQVNPREINLFWLDKEKRTRIVEKEGHLYSLGDNQILSDSDFKTQPEKLSPNALLRPLYQEVILPNLAYVGGMGEIAYWLQLKSTFKTFKVPMPLLVVRNSMAFLNEKQVKLRDRLGITNDQFFLPEHQLLENRIATYSDLGIPFERYADQLEKMFSELHKFATATDATFGDMVNAQHKKQIKGLAKMQKRMIKAEGKKMFRKVEQIKELRQKLYPNGKLQERHYNFATYYANRGAAFFDEIYDAIAPFSSEFQFVVLGDLASKKES